MGPSLQKTFRQYMNPLRRASVMTFRWDECARCIIRSLTINTCGLKSNVIFILHSCHFVVHQILFTRYAPNKNFGQHKLKRQLPFHGQCHRESSFVT